MKIIKEINWKLFMFKIKLRILKIDVINKYMRKNYCKFGIHHLTNGYVSYSGTGQRMKHIRFLKCEHCNYLFFAKKSDKERYLKHEQQTKDNTSALFKNLSSGKLKRLKPLVDSKNRDVSVRN